VFADQRQDFFNSIGPVEIRDETAKHQKRHEAPCDFVHRSLFDFQHYVLLTLREVFAYGLSSDIPQIALAHVIKTPLTQSGLLTARFFGA
jgi:hypothetical protein